jgi:diguanylate cyclase (GGDEF)-like protein
MDADPWAFYADRRHRKLSSYGCMDEATGVLSTGYIHTHLRESLTTYAEHRMPCGILCIQVDSMERFGAAYGAAAVTAALRAVGQSVERSLRPTDFVGHAGGNIFLAVLTEYTGPDLSKTAERLRDTVNNMKIAWWGDELPVTASFGGATVVGTGGKRAGEKHRSRRGSRDDRELAGRELAGTEERPGVRCS